jgi:hypothetical protein
LRNPKRQVGSEEGEWHRLRLTMMLQYIKGKLSPQLELRKGTVAGDVTWGVFRL